MARSGRSSSHLDGLARFGAPGGLQELERDLAARLTDWQGLLHRRPVQEGATVLAGSGAEALLLWALQGQEQKKSGTLAAAVAALLANKTLRHDPGPNPEGRDWSLHQYVEVAAHLRLIKDDTATLVRLTKDFRNLIHPGRAARVGQKCDRSTALGALAAVEAVARDLTPP